MPGSIILTKFVNAAYAKFLNYCTEQLFLRKGAGRYEFIHGVLLEHFASLTKEDLSGWLRRYQAITNSFKHDSEDRWHLHKDMAC
jgi:hypothetical protein